MNGRSIDVPYTTGSLYYAAEHMGTKASGCTGKSLETLDSFMRVLQTDFSRKHTTEYCARSPELPSIHVLKSENSGVLLRKINLWCRHRATILFEMDPYSGNLRCSRTVLQADFSSGLATEECLGTWVSCMMWAASWS